MASKITSNSAWNNYQSVLKAKPGDFKFSGKKPKWSYDESTLNAYYDALLNRKDFTFDLNNNALYNQHRDIYTKQGKLAMMDTIGQASAMTGGYGNSYAVSSGQQAYQQNLDKLSEMVPDIYGLALQQYQLEGEQLYNKYALAAGERDVAYNQFLDSLNQYYTDYDTAYQQYNDSYNRWENDVSRTYGIYGDARDYEYNEERDAQKDRQWLQEFEAEQAARDKEHEMWQQEFAAEQAARDREYAMWQQEFNETYGKKNTTGVGAAAGAILGASAIAGTSAQSTQEIQKERLVALNMSLKEEEEVMELMEYIVDMGISEDKEAVRKLMDNELIKDITVSQYKALEIIFLGE